MPLPASVDEVNKTSWIPEDAEELDGVRKDTWLRLGVKWFSNVCSLSQHHYQTENKSISL